MAKVYGEVSNTLKYVRAASARVNDGDAAKIMAMAYVNNVQASLTQARLVQQKTGQLMQQFDTAPGTLTVAVKDINAHVNEALGNTIQSLSALPGILSGMGNLYTDNKSYFAAFSPAEGASPTGAGEGIETQGAGASQKDLAKDLLKRLDDLAQKNTELEQATSDLHNLLDRYTPKPSSLSLQECGIDTSDIGAGISVNPTSLSFTEGSTAAQSVSVNGGSGTYVVIANQTYLTIEQTPAFGGLVTIKLNNSKPGNHIVKVKDTTGRVQEFMVSVSPKSSTVVSNAANGETQGGADGGSQSPLCQSEELLAGEADFCTNPALTETLQQALVEELSLPADFVNNLYGIETRERVIEMLERPVFDHLADDITPVTLQAILDYQYQKANLEEQDIDALVAPLDSGQNTSVEKIMQFQNTQEGLQPTGFIGEQTVEAICAKHQGIGQCG
ncbi:hypothetical protein [Lacimicrobium alkaliphilum]|uniref:Peptidoglycan binding-like domain-containing protein n=1 Tax=Lacimicrobium alkaliphilum TaxID=1526571 RepID=A0ABQ1RAI3_9ALTE|nr:hypothetical protein [Lacimicrobium alkaliphilum]GGD60743.1 hypothetical protein GCM10011357_15070 [Lacimicrobium alkaliphilum]